MCFWLPSLGVCHEFFCRKIKVGGCINATICTPSATTIIVFFRPKLIGWPKQCLLNGPPLPPCGVYFWGAPYCNKIAEKAPYKSLFWGLKTCAYSQSFIGAVKTCVAEPFPFLGPDFKYCEIKHRTWNIPPDFVFWPAFAKFYNSDNTDI